MHNNYYFLRQLSRVLDKKLQGFTLVSAFTQNKEELILEFNKAHASFFLRANLSPTFCCLSFPYSFNRARKNSVDLFGKALLKKVQSVHQYENERSFSIALEGNLHLLFKMHGSRGNVVMFDGDVAVEVFRNQFGADLNLRRSLDRTINWTKEFFSSHQDKLHQTYITFGKDVWAWLQGQGFDEAEVTTRWSLFQETRKLLENPGYVICENQGKVSLMLLPVGKTVKKFSDPISAINEFYYLVTVTGALLRDKSTALRKLQTRLDRGQDYIAKNRGHLTELEHDSRYQNWADLLMANMNHVNVGMEKVIVDDFYSQQPVEIKLKKNLTAQKNAEVYYRKAKNQQIEIQKLKESIVKKEGELSILLNEIHAIEGEMDVKKLRKLLEKTDLAQKPKQQQVSLPYREFEFKGFHIWVGKSAESNDELTLKYSFKDDLWLHAKDVAGSHVLIKYQSGKPFPKDVIERAAQLAAYHSKRKNESLCPVAVTPKKFVRKRKGDPAGVVVVERETVILVNPSQ